MVQLILEEMDIPDMISGLSFYHGSVETRVVRLYQTHSLAICQATDCPQEVAQGYTQWQMFEHDVFLDRWNMLKYYYPDDCEYYQCRSL